MGLKYLSIFRPGTKTKKLKSANLFQLLKWYIN
jgi:hypothetical protein